MEHKNVSRDKILQSLSKLPERILSADHATKDLTARVLHELCSPNVLDVTKAAYFVENPDFDCCKGVAGYDANECSSESCDIWDDSPSISKKITSLPYHSKIRTMTTTSIHNHPEDNHKIIQDVGRQIGMANPDYYTWKIKNGNYGVFIFDKAKMIHTLDKELLSSVCILGFCPIL